MQKKYQRRYFKDTSAVKSFVSALLQSNKQQLKDSLWTGMFF